MRERFDIAVVGAGPAGTVAALHAAGDGRRVVLLERKRRAGLPVRCGEGIGVKGFEKTIPLNRSWVKSEIKTVHLVSPSGLTVRVTGIDGACVIDRERFEADLVSMAAAKGVCYRNETNIVTVTEQDGRYCCGAEDGREFEAPCVILAEGVESRLARQLGWNTTLAGEDIETCAFCRIRSDAILPDTGILHFGNRIAPGGYVWIFPRGEGCANVGLGILGSKSGPGKAMELLKQYVADRFPGCVPEEVHCGGDPVTRWLKPLVRGGVMLVGDAARQVDCLTGGGITYAMVAGKLAGTAAAQACTGGTCDRRALAGYERRWARTCGKQQARSYALKRVAVGYDDAMLDWIARAFEGRKPSDVSYVKILLRAFSRRPLLMLKALLLFR